MTPDDIREIKYCSACLARDEKFEDTYDPAYFPRLLANWEIYKACGLDMLFEPSAEERERIQRVVSGVTEKLEFYDKLGILPKDL